MVSRVLMVVAAAMLVVGFTIATFVPPDLPLGQFMLQQDHGSLVRMRAAFATLPNFVWPVLVMPLLQRPVWLLPLMVGIVALGGAISARPRTPPQRRPRSR